MTARNLHETPARNLHETRRPKAAPATAMPSDETPSAALKTALITVGAGPRNARTDPTTGLRFYRWKDAEYPSVTTIQRMAGMPHGLHQWAVGQVIKHVVGHADEIAGRLSAAAEIDLRNGPGSQLGHSAVAAIIGRELRAAATAERDRAATLGTAVHDAAATGRSVGEVDESLRPRLAQYLQWLEASGAEILASEFQLWSPSVGYAGTADLLVRLRDGRIYLVDLKTGKGVYRDHALQLMAYLMADFVGSDGVVDEDVTTLLHQASGMAVLHLADAGWEFLAFRADSGTWDAFRGLLTFAKWMTAGDVASLTIGRRAGAAPLAEAS